MTPERPQSVRDALADAEALHKIARSVYRGYAYKGTDIYLAGMCAETHMASALDPNSKYVGDFWILAAARHAFKAVPALRTPDTSALREQNEGEAR